jgi:hypothetical protein
MMDGRGERAREAEIKRGWDMKRKRRGGEDT